MSEPIKVGGLGLIYRTCCERSGKFIGTVFTVANIECIAESVCEFCGCRSMTALVVTGRSQMPLKAPMPYVKRIPPLSELESEKKKDEVPA